MKLPKKIYYARQKHINTEKVFDNEKKAIAFVREKGLVETFELGKDGYYYFLRGRRFDVPNCLFFGQQLGDQTSSDPERRAPKIHPYSIKSFFVLDESIKENFKDVRPKNNIITVEDKVEKKKAKKKNENKKRRSKKSGR